MIYVVITRVASLINQTIPNHQLGGMYQILRKFSIVRTTYYVYTKRQLNISSEPMALSVMNKYVDGRLYAQAIYHYMLNTIIHLIRYRFVYN